MTSLLSFSESAWRTWFSANRNMVYPIIGLYLLGIFVGQELMRTRKPFRVQGALFAWNLSLAIFSLFGSINTAPEMLKQLDLPWFTSVCTNEHRSSTSRFWFLLFVLSKVVELGDTAFIILRKRPLLFLHWYHHISILWICWSTYEYMNSTSGWHAALNYTIHAIMYTYYAIRTLKFTVPQFVSMTLTGLQVLQFIAGLSCTMYAIVMKFQGHECDTDPHHIWTGFLINFSYILLFLQFFQNSYLSSSKSKKID